MALKADGTVLVWGNNIDGETNVPPGLSNVVAIAAGAYHCLALKSDGNVVAWGANDSGQTNVPAWLNHVVAIVAGANHTLALMSGEPSAGTLCLTNMALHTNCFTVRVPTIRGRAYYLECKDSLTDPRWILRQPVPGDGTIRQLADPWATTTQRFYRVRQQ
jgi:phage-related tail fiber protein